jgi:predicted transcriptional regulator
MNAIDLITDAIPPLRLTDTGSKALNWMDEFKVRHLPLTDNLKYIGLISDSNILDMNVTEDALENHTLSLPRIFVTKHQHIYDIIKIASSLKLSLVPVVEEEIYLGNIPSSHLFNEISKMSSIQDIGGVIILELNANDYSLAEIGQIVESNDAKILSSYITSHTNSTQLELTIKINKTNISDILQTFNRYDYVVKASYHDDEFAEDYKDRLEYFMNYINI